MDLVAPPLIATLLKNIDMVVPGLKYQRTLFVGSPCADEGTVGLVSRCSLAEVGPALQRSLEVRAREEQVSMIVWKDFPDGSGKDIETLCKTFGLFKLISYPGTRIPLNVSSFNQYLERLSSGQRYKLKMKLRKSHNMGLLDDAEVQFPDNAVIEEIYHLFRQTYERGKTKFERLTPEFFRIMASEPSSYFITLRDPSTGKPVAFMLCFLSTRE